MSDTSSDLHDVESDEFCVTTKLHSATVNGLQTLSIPCLEEIPAIKNRCITMGLRISSLAPQTKEKKSYSTKNRQIKRVVNGEFNKNSSYVKKRKTAEYEVESILDVSFSSDIIKGTELYLVKWKNWDSVFNSWEPMEHLTNCHKFLSNFYQNISRQMSPLLRDEANCDSQTAVINNNGTIQDLENSDVTFEILRQYTIKRKDVQEKLKRWEIEINEHLPENHQSIIVENDVDLEGPPLNFVYINEYKAGEGINIPSDPLVGCECESGCYNNKKKCCVTTQSGAKFAYDKMKRVVVPPGTPIYECNMRCKCEPSCFNRVVQHGSKVKLAIFRTSNGCGWGVKCLQKIKKNVFVMEYVGEVISTEEAERRGRVYDEEGRTYLFDLDFEDTDCPYTVDAAHYGNISHFMNHSCDPNLVVYGVWINTLDPGMPRLAYFSKRDIAIGEELTFDYMLPCNRNTRSPDAKVKQIRCMCGSSNCRKFLT